MTVKVAVLPEFSKDCGYKLRTNVKHELVRPENRYLQINTYLFIHRVWRT